MSTTTQNADGHWTEFPPLMRQEFKRIGGDRSLRRLGMTSF